MVLTKSRLQIFSKKSKRGDLKVEDTPLYIKASSIASACPSPVIQPDNNNNNTLGVFNLTVPLASPALSFVSTLGPEDSAPSSPRINSIRRKPPPKYLDLKINQESEISTELKVSIITVPSASSIPVTDTNIDPITMTSTPPHASSSQGLVLSLFVLLPASAHMQHQMNPITPLSRPSPMATRVSGGSVSTLRTISQGQEAPGALSPELQHLGEIHPEADMSAKMNANRRLSLAPGMGGGTQTKQPKLGSSLGDILRPLSGRRISDEGNTSTSRERSSITKSSLLDGLKPLKSLSKTKQSSASASFGMSAMPETMSREEEDLSPLAPSGPNPFGAPKFGSGSRAMGRRRPNTAATESPRTNQLARGSMALPSGMGLGIGVGGKSRPGWEGDQVVTTLRTGGLEVTVIRNASHLPSILNPRTSSPSLSTFTPASISNQKSTETIPVILVPLCDSPSLPSLSLLLSQGTTPTAVCFQQDLLDRAKRTEEEWLPSALEQIRLVLQISEKALIDENKPTPVILAYSANNSLTPSTIQACIDAGASGVLRPPYDLETARTVRRMVRAAKEGRISSIVGLPASSGLREVSPGSPLLESGSEIRVVLPPTALKMGDGQHEAERALSLPSNHSGHRRGTSASGQQLWNNTSIYKPDSRGPSPSSGSRISRTPAGSNAPSRKTSKQENAPLNLVGGSGVQQKLPLAELDLINHQRVVDKSKALGDDKGEEGLIEAVNHLFLYNPSLTARRRSVDVGGLTVAMKRAQKAFEVTSSNTTNMITNSNVNVNASSSLTGNSKTSGGTGSQMASPKTPKSKLNGFAFPGTPDRKVINHNGLNGDGSKNGGQHAAGVAGISGIKDDEVDTHLAELLGAMYYQTCLTIDVQMAQYEEFAKPMTKDERNRLIEEMSTWHFKPHRLSQVDLYRVACLIFESVLNIEGVVELGLDQQKINKLLFAIRAIYHAPNPYHNYIHAIDVLQATYSFLMDIGVAPPWSFLLTLESGKTQPWSRPDEDVLPVHGLGTRRAREVLRPQDVFGVVVAAMGHDVGHPGLSNAFMKNAKVPLSEVYEDKSCLENMHCMLVIQLLRKHGFGFLINCNDSGTNDPDYTKYPARRSFDSRGFRKVLYSSVLATDMSLHFAWISQLKEFGYAIERGEVGLKTGVEGEEEKEDDRIMLCQAFIKCADISNPTRPIDVSEHWSTVLLEEWAKQASLETDLSLPVSVIASADQALQAKGQVGFIDLFTQPLFEAVSDVVPELQTYSDYCSDNRTLWSSRLEQLQQSGNTLLIQPPIQGASIDDRFKSLFPLSLPTSLVEPKGLEPGPLPTSTGSGDNFTDMGYYSPMDVAFPSSSTLPPLTPTTAPFGGTPKSIGKGQNGNLSLNSPPGQSQSQFGSNGHMGSPVQQPHSPATKAMRAVYHGNLLNQQHRMTSTVSRGIPIPGVGDVMDVGRRASTPDGLTVHVYEHGRFDKRFLKA